jgi:hypothetical protein
MDFCSLEHKSDIRVHYFAGFPPPASFHLQGLTTLLMVCSPHVLARFISSLPRLWDSPLRSLTPWLGSTVFPRCLTHMLFTNRMIRTSPNGCGLLSFWALILPKEPRCFQAPEELSHRVTPLRFTFLGYPESSLGSPFEEPPLLCFVPCKQGPALQSFDQPLPGAKPVTPKRP